jgi:hypothetical protein
MTQSTPQRKKQSRLILGLGLLVIAISVTSALFFGETSPVIAQGRIVLSEELTAQAQGMRRLFIIVRDAESPMPMPWGALDVTLSADPSGDVYSFILTRDNLRIMNQGGPLPKKLSLKARLDLDGIAGLDEPGDIVGSIGPVDFGSKDQVITLSSLVAESAAMPQDP